MQVDDDGNIIATVQSSDSISVNGGVGDDFIINYGGQATIYGGVGDDSISNRGIITYNAFGSIVDFTTTQNDFFIDAGAGRDTIDNRNHGGQINLGADNDMI